MKKTTIALALSAVLTMSACGIPTSASTEEPPSTGSSEPAETTEDEATETTTDSPTPDQADLSEEPEGQSLVQSFGETFIYDDGIKVIVSEPTQMVSSYNEKGSSFQVTVANTGDTQFDPGLMSLNAQSGSAEAEQIFDTANGYEGSPTTILLPGRDVTFKVAFVTADPNDIVLEVSPSWDHEAVIYATNGG